MLVCLSLGRTQMSYTVDVPLPGPVGTMSPSLPSQILVLIILM